jgi:MFS family permease
MTIQDWILLLHPAISVAVVFPLLGIVVNRALQTRNRRLQLAHDGKSKIPPVAGQEHVQIGQWLTGTIVGVTLLALAYDVVGHLLEDQLAQKQPIQTGLIVLSFGVAISSLAALYWARQRFWRGVFATLTGTSIVMLGCQEGVYRNTENWFKSHYYYGITATLLVIFSLAILPEIYKDRTNRWRTVHIVFNSIALLLFLGQSVTGTLSLLETPLHWQESYVQTLYEQQCNRQPCTIQPPEP